MKRNIFLIAFAALMLTFAACNKDEDNTPNNNTPVANDPFPGGTRWEWSMDSVYAVELEDTTVNSNFSMGIQLDFATTGHKGDMLIHMATTFYFGDEAYPVDDTESSPFTWTYDASQHTGILTGQSVNEETGETETADIPFTYDPDQDVIIIDMSTDEPGDGDEEEEEMDFGIPSLIILHRVPVSD